MHTCFHPYTHASVPASTTYPWAEPVHIVGRHLGNGWIAAGSVVRQATPAVVAQQDIIRIISLIAAALAAAHVLRVDGCHLVSGHLSDGWR